MQHLFLINPVAAQVKGHLDDIQNEINSFFSDIGLDNYHIHVTRWVRDGMGYANRFALECREPVRIHVVGGSGSLYEAINGTIGLPNVQIAAYPMGGNNFFVHYFRNENEHLFRNLRYQVFSGTIAIDAIRNENNYAVGYAIIGLEAISDRDGTEMLEVTNLPNDFCYLFTAIRTIFNSAYICQHYKVEIDGRDFSGEYLSMLIAGGPCYGHDMTPAPEAHPNDGLLDFYLVKKMPPLKILSVITSYTSGYHGKLGEIVVHERGKSIKISGEKDMFMSFDGEGFYERSLTYEVVPGAIDFVCPCAIDVKKLPKLYNQP